MARRSPPTALTIAGSDSGGGAGLQADLKTFQRFGVYGTSAVTLVTAQNSRGVARAVRLPADLVVAQIEAVASDFAPAATKTGALGSAALVEAVADAAGRLALGPLVVDPVMLSKHGDALLDADAVDALRERLLPRASVLTPNLPEAAALLGGGEARDESEMRDAARALHALGAAAVLVKGGHLARGDAIDVLYDGRTFTTLRSARIESKHTHGTGCTLSAAIAAGLALGDDVETAVRCAKDFVTSAIASAPGLGSGAGPLDHWAPVKRGAGSAR